MQSVSVHRVLEPFVIPNSQYQLDENFTQHCSNQLKIVIEDNYRRSTSARTFSSFIDTLTKNANDLISFNDSRDTALLTRCKVVGMAALDCILDVSDESSPERRSSIAASIHKVLEFDKTPIDTYSSTLMLRTAGACIGHFARIASTTEIDRLQQSFMSTYSKLIFDDVESRCYAGLYIHYQLAINLPQLVYVKRKTILSMILPFACKKNPLIRDVAALTLDSILLLISQRESMTEHIKTALKSIQEGFSSNSPENILGSLIILDIVSNGTSISATDLQALVKLSFGDVIMKVFQRKDAREIEIRLKVIDVIPKLVSAFTPIFLQMNQNSDQTILVYALKHLLNATKSSTDRNNAYLALGKLFSAVSTHLRTSSLLNDIFVAINNGFRDPFCVAALSCLSYVIKSSSTIAKRYVTTEVIDAMFRGGFKVDLIETLKIVVKQVPVVLDHTQYQLRGNIAALLQKYVVFVDDSPGKSRLGGTRRVTTSQSIAPLFGSPQRQTARAMGLWGTSGMFHVASNANLTAQMSSTASQDSNQAINIQNNQAETEIILAMKTLASHDFFPKYSSRERTQQIEFIRRDSYGSTKPRSASVHNPLTMLVDTNPPTSSVANMIEYQDQSLKLLRLVSECVVKFFDDCNQDIRKTAVLTTAYVLENIILSSELDYSVYGEIIDVIDRLLLVGVGDDVAEIRAKVFNSLAPSLDYLISQSDSIHCLIEGLSDEDIDVRSAAMVVLCRVAHYDTLRLMPLIRLNLKNLIRQIHNKDDESLRPQSVSLLQAMVRGSDILMAPYVPLLLEPLMQLINDSSATVVSAALTTIAELAFSSPHSVKDYLDDLLSRLILALNDTSSNIQRDTAVAAIGKLVPALTMVTEEPYKKYPGLVEGLFRAIQGDDESAISLRNEAIRTAGLLGIVDSSVYESHLKRLRLQETDFYSQTEELEEIEDDAYGSDDDIPSSETKSKENIENADELKRITMDRFYFGIVIRLLIQILKDRSLSNHHENACKTATKIVGIVGIGALPQMSILIDALVYRLYETERGNNLVDTVIDQLISFVEIIGKKMRLFSTIFIKLIHDLVGSHLQRCLELLDAMYGAFSSSDFTFILNSVLPTLLSLIKKEVAVGQFGETDLSLLPDEDVLVKVSVGSSVSIPSKQSGQIDIVRVGSSLRLPYNLLPSSTPSTSQQVSPAVSSKLATQSMNSAAIAALTGSGSVSKKVDIPDTDKIFTFLTRVSRSLEDYRQQIFPTIIQVIGNSSITIESRKLSLAALVRLSQDIDLSDYSSLVIHPLIRLLGPLTDLTLVGYIMTAISCVLCRLGVGFVPYIITIRRKLPSIPLKDGSKLPQIEEYERIVNRLLKQRSLPQLPASMNDITMPTDQRYRSPSHYVVNAYENDLGERDARIQALQNAWAFGKNDASDLIDWMRRLSIELIRQSPSRVIRSCLILSKVYRKLSEELFYIAFHCIWEELHAGESIGITEEIPLINGIEMALQSVHLPPHLTETLLNLIRFMDMQDRRLPLDIRLLSSRARDSNMFAKCLRYRETEFSSKNIFPSKECIEELITVNNELGLGDRAMGVLHCVMSDFSHISIEPIWLEKLNLWEEARESHTQHSNAWRNKFPNDNPFTNPAWASNELGLLRCLTALGEYDHVQQAAKLLKTQLKKYEAERDASPMPTTLSLASSTSAMNTLTQSNTDHWMTEIQRLGAHSSWMLGQWDDVEDFIDYSNRDSLSIESLNVRLDRNISFYLTIVAVQKQEYSKAMSIISETRNRLSNVISALLSEIYPRAYRAMVTMQILAELEEIVEYKEAVANALASNPTSLEIDSSRGPSYSGDSENPTITSPIIPLTPRLTSATRRSTDDMSSVNITSTGMDGNNDIATSRDLLKLKKASLLKKWRGRLKVAPKEISVFRQIIAVHTLVADLYEDLDSVLELVSLCRKEGMYTLCENVLRQLGAPFPPKSSLTTTSSEASDNMNYSMNPSRGFESKAEKMSPIETAISTGMRVSVTVAAAADRSYMNGGNNYGYYRVLLSTMKYWWSSGSRQKALNELNMFIKTLPVFDVSTPSNRGSSSPMVHSTLKRTGTSGGDMQSNTTSQDMRIFRVKCLMKKAEWMKALGEGSLEEIMRTILEARELTPDHYSVWHAWAVVNFEQLQAVDTEKPDENKEHVTSTLATEIPFRGKIEDTGQDFLMRTGKALVARSTNVTNANNDASSKPLSSKYGLLPGEKTTSYRRTSLVTDQNEPSTQLQSPAKQKRRKSVIVQGTVSLANLLSLRHEDKVEAFVKEAIKGFVRSIVLDQSRSSSVLQDTLRLLTLWFSYGTKEGISPIIDTELDKLSPENWLSVLPQLIARLHVKAPEISTTLKKLLIKVATNHPQALVCPIYVALNTNDEQQKLVALEVLSEMRKKRNLLVDEATVVSRELMKVAITPHEMWYDGIEKACTSYLEGNIQSMLTVLTSLHDAMIEDNIFDLPNNVTQSMDSSPLWNGNQSRTSSPEISGKYSNIRYSSNMSMSLPMSMMSSPRRSFASTAVSSNTETMRSTFALRRSTTTLLENVDQNTNSIGKVSLRDISFRHKYGRLLADAKEWLERFKASGITSELHQAWDIYYVVFKKAETQIKTFKKLLLQHVSPELAAAVDLRLAVPGTYQPSQPVISIAKFSSAIRVIQSKQRPRRITITGSDGKPYPFLLKGNEDLRQDERVMQLFGLINVCLNSDNRTRTRSTDIVRYSVMPLSNNSGLIGWVENCDTFNQLITDYRQSRNIRPGVEMKILASKSMNYDMGLSKNPAKNTVTLPQKIEIFEQMLEETTGSDLANVLWLKSRTADIWVERRANYTKSMAVMSMAGYILGLGDRHPSNLMLHRISGRVVHIDFGDCFEITATRAKFPELVPFRLTRMLQISMEKSGIEGAYRVNCERVMTVLRDNKDSVMAMLEAFVYDPLISWRLLTGKNNVVTTNEAATPADTTQAAAGPPMPNPANLGLESPQSPVDILRDRLYRSSSLNNRMNPGISGDNPDGGTNNGLLDAKAFMNDDADPVPVPGALHAVPMASSVIDGGAIIQGRIGLNRPIDNVANDDEPLPENLNARALEVITRIQAKLTGRDFSKSDDADDLSVEEQVHRLILEATSNENLCQMFGGWCPMW